MAFGVLAGVEAGLRACHVGDPIPFFVARTDAAGHPWVMTNPAAANDWFPGPEWDEAVRRPRAQVFDPVKPKDSVRIFVFGESAAYGTPFPDNASWPRMLERILASDHRPGRDLAPGRVEVINCGIRASTLSLAVPVLEETRAWAPDLYVIYAGHNEFYGPRLPAWYERLRMFKLLRGAPVVTATPGGPKVLGIRADFAVTPSDPLRAVAAARFGDSLRAFFAAAAPTPVIAVPVYANERDLAPLGSFEAPGHAAEAAEAKQLVQATEDDPSLASPAVASRAARLLAALPEHAGLEHVLGLAALQAGDLVGARGHFQRSIDADTVPIRAPTALREALLAAVAGADSRRVSACDPGPSFRAATADGAFDHRIFLDHVHLTLLGGFLLASDLARCVTAESGPAPPVPEDELLGWLGVTDVDAVAVANNMTHYYQNATVQASPSQKRSIAYYQALGEERMTRLTTAELSALDGPPDDVHLRVAASGAIPAEQVVAELRRAVLANPGSAAAHAALARLLLASNSAGARDEALRALLLGLPLAEGRALCRQFGLPEGAATVYATDTTSSP